MGIPPARCMMVGDDPLCDVSGAFAVGMKTIWKRNGRPDPAPADVRPTAAIDHLAELPGLFGLQPG